MIAALIALGLSLVSIETVVDDNNPSEQCVTYVTDSLTHITLDTITHTCNPGSE